MMNIASPDFDLLRQTLLNQNASGIPLIELGIHPTVKSAILGYPFKTIDDDIRFMRLMGYDYIKIQPQFSLPLNRQKSGQEDGRVWSPERQGLITNRQEFDTYPWPKPQDIDYSLFEEARRLCPGEMGIIGQYGDIFTNVWELMGFETFVLAIYEDPELIQAIFDKVSDLILGMFKTMADMDWIGVLWYSDDIAYTSGPIVNPDFFRKHFFPLLKQIGLLAAEKNMPLIYHTDGDVRSMMNDIIACGVTALHPIEPKAMDILEIKQEYGRKLCLCGGIDVDLLTRGNTKQIVELTNTMIRDIGKNGGYCLGSSNSIPDYINIQNYKTMVTTAVAAR